MLFLQERNTLPRSLTNKGWHEASTWKYQSHFRTQAHPQIKKLSENYFEWLVTTERFLIYLPMQLYLSLNLLGEMLNVNSPKIVKQVLNTWRTASLKTTYSSILFFKAVWNSLQMPMTKQQKPINTRIPRWEWWNNGNAHCLSICLIFLHTIQMELFKEGYAIYYAITKWQHYLKDADNTQNWCKNHFRSS